MSVSHSILVGFSFTLFVFHAYAIVVMKRCANVLSIKRAFLYLVLFPVSIFTNYQNVLFKSKILALLGVIVFFGYLDAVGYFILFGSSSQNHTINPYTAALGIYILVFMIPIWDVIRSVFGIQPNNRIAL
jgi:hypothetical protein